MHPLSPAFDGFLVHSRGADAAPLSGAGIDPAAVTVGVRIRADNRTPVLILKSEGDIVAPLSFGLARQPDSDWLRLWETAGTAHADADTLGAEQAGSLGVDGGSTRVRIVSSPRPRCTHCTAGSARGHRHRARHGSNWRRSSRW